jgi:hypothetical protein
MRTCGWKNDAIVLVFFAASVVAGFFLMSNSLQALLLGLLVESESVSISVP